MDTAEFFRRVLASKGLVCLAEFKDGKKPHHTFYETADAAADAALALDAKGRTVYHACATYKTNENRKAENAAYMRSFWLDLDVDPENPTKYASLKDAISDVGRICKTLKLPLPLLVKSGSGAHAYWILDADLEAGQWRLVASVFKSVIEHIGAKADRTRTADAASVLRPLGVTWRKREPYRTVECICPGSPISIERFRSSLQAYADGVGSELRGLGLFGGDNGATTVHSSGGLCVSADDLGTKPEYPPSSAERIIQHCATLRFIADVRGNVEEPLWRGMLGLVKHTVEGIRQCHKWSAGHPEYNELETQEKIDGWTTGPTTCAYFRGTNGHRCTGCTHRVSSPIHLGYTAELPPTAPAGSGGGDVDDGSGTEDVGVPAWPKGYSWNGALCYFVRPENENEAGKWVPFCDTLWYPVERIRNEEGVWHLRIRHQAKNHTWREFELPCELIGSQTGLTAALAAHEVFIYGKMGTHATKDLMRQYTLDLQSKSIEQLTYPKLGWADNFRSFILGNRRIGVGQETRILAGEFIKGANWDTDFGTAGTLEEWKRLVDLIYNRPGAEPYQFVIGCAFAAPLVEVAELDNWHGIPVAVTGRGGLGKSTTCKVASSIYGASDYFLVKSTKGGATMNAMISTIGTGRNIPLIFDEITEREPQEMSDFLYSLSDGKPKIRNRADGTIINLGLKWKTISFVTSNKNVTELLARLEGTVAEATQVRVFEIMLTEDDLKIWQGMNAIDYIEHQLMQGNYGHAGREWLRYVIENRGTLREEIRKLRAKYNPDSAEETRERYYRDLIATVAVALKHAAKIGLINFNVVDVVKWAKRNTLKLRVRRQEQSLTPEEYITHFLGSLHGRIIVTKQFRDGRTGVSETPLEQLRGSPLARMALDDKVFVVSRRAINDWCSEQRVQASWLLEEMGKRGLLRYNADGSVERKDRIAKGTNIPGMPAGVVELSYDMVLGTMKEKEE